jgi:quercetin dioxygenase-like cupin family protein
VEFIGKDEIVEFSNPGVTSRQLLSPNNSSSSRVTITEVHVEPGSSQPRHTHTSSEQIWYALTGVSTLLLAADTERRFETGDVVRFEDGDVHGLRNDGDTTFVYLSVTAPPIDFGYAYTERR